MKYIVGASFLLLIFGTTTLAAPVPTDEYEASMTQLDEIEHLLRDTHEAFTHGMSASSAQTLKPVVADHLDWLRETKRKAARRDITATPVNQLNAERRRARCLVMRAGLMDPPLQDLSINLALRARGASNMALIPPSAAKLPKTSGHMACRTSN